MRNLIVGAVGVLWGGGVLIYSFTGDQPRGQGAYGAGQTAGTVIGAVMFLAGRYYLIDGVRSLGGDQEEEPRPRKRKKKRRPVREDDE